MSRDAPAPGMLRPWYREPWVWLIIAIPLLTVIGGMVTLTLAIRTADERVTDDFRKEGVAIYQDPRRDTAAAERGVTAELSIDRDTAQVAVRLAMLHGDAPAEMLLVLSHATRAELDHLVVLRRDAQDYAGRLARIEAGRWYLELTPRDRSWRLTGVLEPGEDARLRLVPPAVD